jgi:hypothetical protein
MPAFQIPVPQAVFPQEALQVSDRRFLTGPRLAILAALVLALAGGAYVFTASNSVADSGNAGEGESAQMSGYTANTVSWSLDAANPSNIQKVSFQLSPVTASTNVFAGSDNGTTITWSNACTQGTVNAGVALETCTFATEPTASGTQKLAVSAAN